MEKDRRKHTCSDNQYMKIFLTVRGAHLFLFLDRCSIVALRISDLTYYLGSRRWRIYHSRHGYNWTEGMSLQNPIDKKVYETDIITPK